jgi:hypothetical protein
MHKIPNLDEHGEPPAASGDKRQFSADGRPALLRELVEGHARHDVTHQVASENATEAAIALTGDSSFSEQLKKIYHELGGEISMPVLMELLDCMAEEGMLSGRSRSPSLDSPKWQANIIRILEYLKRNPGAINIYAVIYIFNDPLLDDINEHLIPAQFARKVRVTKAAVTKAVVAAQEFFKLPPRSGQRKTVARENMRDSRNQQLKK